MLLGKPLFPGKNVVHQLDLMTDFLGTPPPEAISKVSYTILDARFSNFRKLEIWFKKNYPLVEKLFDQTCFICE